MKYERLTLRTVHGEVQQLTTRAGILDRLADLEDKIESGKMIELLCKVGERIYYTDEYIAEFDRVEEYTVEKIEIVKDQIRIWFGDNIGYALAENFGKEVFTDKSQAKARLKELQGE